MVRHYYLQDSSHCHRISVFSEKYWHFLQTQQADFDACNRWHCMKLNVQNSIFQFEAIKFNLACHLCASYTTHSSHTLSKYCTIFRKNNLRFLLSIPIPQILFNTFLILTARILSPSTTLHIPRHICIRSLA